MEQNMAMKVLDAWSSVFDEASNIFGVAGNLFEGGSKPFAVVSMLDVKSNVTIVLRS